jgi:hypothetical protein
MKLIVRKNCFRYLIPGAKIRRIITHYNGSQIKNDMKVIKGIYTRFVETFQKDCEFIKVRSSKGFPTDKDYEYFLSDLFNGDVYLLEEGDMIPIEWPSPGLEKDEEEEKEYITDEDLEIEI